MCHCFINDIVRDERERRELEASKFNNIIVNKYSNKIYNFVRILIDFFLSTE